MSKHQPVVWSEGLLLAPQHLQQWDRATQYFVAERFRQSGPFEWGISQIEIDREALRNGRLALLKARGVLPEGTAFAAGVFEGAEATLSTDPLPAPRTLDGHFEAKQEVLTVYLGLPMSRTGRPQVGPVGVPGQPTPRYTEETLDLPDANTGGDERAVAVARRNLVLLFPDDALGDHDHVPIAEVQRTADGGFALRETFVPPCLSIGASPALVALLGNQLERLIAKCNEIGGMRRQRGKVVDFSSADTTSFLKLYAINGAIPALMHALALRRAHPEQVYRDMASLAGALCTFTDKVQAKDLPGYDHRALGTVFTGLHKVICEVIDDVTEQKATRIDLEKKDGSVWLGRIADDRLFAPGASFFLGVKADVEEVRLITEMPVKLKIASNDRIDFLIAMALQGVRVRHERVPPAALPVKSQFVYFQIDPNHELWEGVKGAKNIAFFVPPEYPGLSLDLLGLRE